MSSGQRYGKRRLKGFDYSSANAYFITTNIRRGFIRLGHIVKGEMFLNENGEIVSHCWHDLANHYQMIELDEFVVMPDHVHGIVFLLEPPNDVRKYSLSTIVGSFKSYSARRINERLNRVGIPIWQTSFYDRIIRDENELEKFRKYIRTNPLRWSLSRDGMG